jgi:hypothetical protein
MQVSDLHMTCLDVIAIMSHLAKFRTLVRLKNSASLFTVKKRLAIKIPQGQLIRIEGGGHNKSGKIRQI